MKFTHNNKAIMKLSLGCYFKSVWIRDLDVGGINSQNNCDVKARDK